MQIYRSSRSEAKPEELTGEAIRARRLKLGMTQRQLASAAGVGHKTIHHIERGRKPFGIILRRVLEALRLPPQPCESELKARRLELEFTVMQLAKVCGVHHAVVSGIERNLSKYKNCIAARERMMAALGMLEGEKTCEN